LVKKKGGENTKKNYLEGCVINMPHIIKVAALTGGKYDPSARFRVRQLIPALLQEGIIMDEFIPVISKYPPLQKWLRPLWAIGALTARIPGVIATHRYDVIFLQRELISTLVTLEPMTKRPRVLDVDDAIFLHRGGKFAERLAQKVELIICGNDFIAERFSEWNKNIAVIPTVVDSHRYIPGKGNCTSNSKQVIGWIGISRNFNYLYKIESALERVIKARPEVILKIISDRRPKFKGKLSGKFKYVKWSPKTEIADIQSITIGIMPLDNTDWEKGKCSFKMLQYMSCNIPVVVSPVGMNAQILNESKVGFGVNTLEEWTDALIYLLDSSEKRKKMGFNGRKLVEEKYSIDAIMVKLSSYLKIVGSV
jgi:glycosyltransferase involved in cell wall biosynthesis